VKGVTTMAVPALTENDLRDALKALEAFKTLNLKTSRFDTELDSGTVISFQRKDTDSEWVVK
jgi:beta-lactam-binding protein with PASTA domain